MHISNDPLDASKSNMSKLRVRLKSALQSRHVWGIRTRLQLSEKVRDLALFNVAIDSKLRGCDVVRLKVESTGRYLGVEVGDAIALAEQ